ncbi:hypothetical protein IE81DRAFT_331093 [Ceraceosorus guamensis]|uniref:Uncharacterized protein n=1 Tax=Ceraceosorus guamensis TaxID=1522189 RepID=A0A316VY38_9BASI|nr:hypothetical protein IE81DRAFT_331093 [Ceraceosorus guamensis]PWN41211.1 hypothetical protein IE81DRAFT_331093 [Ceraceosorus guamensis]
MLSATKLNSDQDSRLFSSEMAYFRQIPKLVSLCEFWAYEITSSQQFGQLLLAFTPSLRWLALVTTTYTIDFSGPSNDDSSSGSNSEGPQPSSETSSEPLGDSYDNTSAAEPSSASSANSPTGGQEEGSDSSSTTPSSASASEGEPHSGTPASSASDDGQSSDEQQVPFSGSSNHTPPVPDSATEESPSVSHSPVDVPSPAPVPPANVTTAEPLHPAPTPQPPPPPPSTKSGPPQIPPAAPENVRAMLLDKIPKAAMLGSDIHTASWRISANIPPIILGLVNCSWGLPLLEVDKSPFARVRNFETTVLYGQTSSDAIYLHSQPASESPIANVISGLLTSITLTGHFAFLACLAGTVLAPSIAEMEEKQSEPTRHYPSPILTSTIRLLVSFYCCSREPASARPPPPPRAVITRHRQENAGVENKSGVDPARMSAGGRHVLSRLINQVRGQNATPENPAQSAPRLASGGLDDFGDPFESPELPIEMDSALSASEYHYLAQFADGGKEPCGLSAVTEESVPESEQSQSNLWQVRTGPRLQPKNQASYWQIRAGSTPIRAGANTPHRRSQVSSKTRPAHPSVHQETMMASEVRPLSQVTRLSQILASPAPTKIRSPGSSFVSAASDDDYAAGAVIISHPGVAPSAQEYGVARKVSYKASHHRHDSDASAISAVDQRDSMTSHEIIAARAQCDDAPEMPADARINSGSRYSGESWDAGFKARNDARRSKWRSHPLQRSSTGLSKRSSMPFDSQELEGFPLPPQEEGVHDTSRIGDEVRATLADAGSISGSSYEQNSLTPSTRISALLTAVGWNGSRKSEGPEPGTAPSAYGPDHPDGTFIRAPSPQRQSNSTHLSVTSRPDALSKVAYDTSGAGAGRPMSAVPEVREVAARIDQPYSNANLGTADRVSVIPSIVSPADSTSNAAGPEEVGGRPSEHELTVPRAAHIVGGPNQLAWPTQNSKPAAQLLSPQDADESEDHLPSSAKGYIERPLPPTPDGKYTGPQERPGSSRSRSGSSYHQD